MEAFVSYAREDRDFVDALAAALERRERSLWIDRRRIRPLTEWLAELLAAIANAEHFLIVLSPDWLESRVCPNELEEAMRLRKALVPLHWRDVDPERVHAGVGALQWIDFRDPAAFEDAVEQLLAALDRDLESVRYQTRLLRRALDWSEQGRRRANLLAAEDLAEAERFLAAGADVPEPVREYVHVSAAEAVRTRTFRGIAAGVLALMVVVTGAWIVSQRRASTRTNAESASRALAARARDLSETEPDRALLTAVDACRKAPTFEAQSVLWDELSAAPNLLGVLHHRKHLTAMALNPDGRFVAIGDLNGIVSIVDVESRRVSGTVQAQSAWVKKLFWSRGNILAVIGNDENVVLLNPKDGKILRTLRFGAEHIDAIAINGSGQLLAVVHGSVVELYETGSGRLVHTPIRMPVGGAKSVAFSPDGNLLAAGATWGAVYVYSLRDHSPVGAPPVANHVGIGALAFSPDGAVLAAGAEDGSIALLRTSDVRPGVPSLFGHTQAVTSLDFNGDGMLVSASEDRTVRLWRWRESDAAQPPLVFHRDEVIGAAFRPDGKTLVSAGESYVLLWRTARHRALTGHTRAVSNLAWSRDGRLYSSSIDESVREWNVNTFMAVRSFSSPYHTGRGLAVAPDRSFVASSSWRDGSVVIWNGSSGTMSRARVHRGIVWALTADDRGVYSADENSLTALARSPRGTALAGARDGPLLFYDVEGAHYAVAVPAHTSRVRNLAYSADGSLLLSHGEDRRMILWDAKRRTPLHSFATEANTGTAALSPDGARIASAAPRALTLWEAASERKLGRAMTTGWSDDIAKVAFSPDGDTLAVATGTRIEMLEASPRAWMRRACAILVRGTMPDPDYDRVCGSR